VTTRFARPNRIPGRSAVATAAPAVHREAVILGAVMTALVLISSLTPFQFQSGTVSRLTWISPTCEDLVVNLLVYLPVGFTLFGGLSRWLRRRRWAVLAATAGAAGLSLSIETLQTFSAARWASWTDVMLNTLGGLAGACIAPRIGLAVQGLAAAAQRAWRRCPSSVMSVALTLGVVLHGLAPFDFVRNATEFRTSLLASQWWPIAERYAPPHAIPRLNPYAGLLSTLSFSGLFFLLAAVQTLARRASGRNSRAAMVEGVGHAALVAVLVEVLQLFLRSRVFSTLDVVTAIVAGVAGAGLATFAGNVRDACGRMPRWLLNARSAAVAIVAAYQVAWHLAFGLAQGELGAESCVPFATLFRLPFVQAVGVMAGTVLAYTLLSSTLALLCWSVTDRVRWGWVTLPVVGVAVAAAWCRAGSVVRMPDVTPVCLAMVAVIFCGLSVRLLQPARVAAEPIRRAGGRHAFPDARRTS